MSNLGDTVVRFLGDKKKQRWIIESSDLFELLNNMGILNDPEALNVVLEHLEDSGIDVNFRDTDSEYYKIFKDIERRFKFLKDMKFKRQNVTDLIKKMDDINVKPDDSWLDSYRNDTEEDENPVDTVRPPVEVNPDIVALNERIMNEVTDRIIHNMNQMSDEQRLEQAMNQLNDLHNIINNNNQ